MPGVMYCPYEHGSLYLWIGKGKPSFFQIFKLQKEVKATQKVKLYKSYKCVAFKKDQKIVKEVIKLMIAGIAAKHDVIDKFLNCHLQF